MQVDPAALTPQRLASNPGSGTANPLVDGGPWLLGSCATVGRLFASVRNVSSRSALQSGSALPPHPGRPPPSRRLTITRGARSAVEGSGPRCRRGRVRPQAGHGRQSRALGAANSDERNQVIVVGVAADTRRICRVGEYHNPGPRYPPEQLSVVGRQPVTDSRPRSTSAISASSAGDITSSIRPSMAALMIRTDGASADGRHEHVRIGERLACESRAYEGRSEHAKAVCAGEPHARFEVAAGGNQASRQRRAAQAPPADPTTSSGRPAIAVGTLAMRSRMCHLDRQSPRGRFGWLCGSNNGGRLCDSVRDDAHQPGARRGWLKPARRAGRVPFGLRCSGLGAGWVAGGCAVRGEEGEVVPGDVSEDFDDVLRCGFRAGVVEL